MDSASMETREELINRIVRQVVDQVQAAPRTQGAGQCGPKPAGTDGVFARMEDAIGAADQAQTELNQLTLEKRRRIIRALREAALAQARDFSERTYAETGMGRVQHKIAKHEIAIRLTPGIEDLEQRAWTGDNGLTVEEMAPYGVIGAITPSTHPVPTLISNAIAMIAAGNSAVFNPHPGAKQVFAYALRVFNRALVGAGAPANLITTVAEPTLETGQILFTHPRIALLCVTGGPGLVRAALGSGKKVIAAGPGNPPVVVDETADIDKAARDIIEGATFDNNILCIAEKEVFVVDSVAEQLKQALKQHGGYELAPEQIDALAQKAFGKDAQEKTAVNRELVGRDASVLAGQIGLTVDRQTLLLFGETAAEHIFVNEEQMMPFLPLVRVPDVNQGIEQAMKAEHGYRHTAIMHSRNIAALSQMAKVINTTIFVKNGPSGAGAGVGGEGTNSFSIASTTGEGIITAKHFTRRRRCTLVDYFRIV